MNFTDSMNYFYYRTAIGELTALHGGDYSPGLTHHNMLYLNIISGIPDCTVSKIADVLKITRSGVTIKINDLVQRGFVEKKQSAKDGRVWYITLSPEMAEIYAMFDNLSVKIETYLKERYSVSDIELFSRMLCDVADFSTEDAND